MQQPNIHVTDDHKDWGSQEGDSVELVATGSHRLHIGRLV
jgi:hypothetical protein